MIKKLSPPLVGAALSLVLSVGVGVFLCSRTLGPLLEAAATVAAAHAPKEAAELKQKGWDFWTIEIENLSNELKDERLRLKKQSDLLDQRAARLAAGEKELAKVRTDVVALRQEIVDRVTEISADEQKNIRTLAQTYTNLTPRAVVAIFKEMDDATAVKILSLMKPDVVGPIFEQMAITLGADGTPLARRAAILSEKLRLMKASKPPTPS
jgi:flagellar motility protein MotE (MotC chaperone)